MGYRYEESFSPNYTPGNQVQAIYGRPRTIEFGAGHWWGDPNAGYSHQGVINTFMNPARQASAHFVISEGRVTRMVRNGDAAWATNNANPFTVAIELKPNMTAGDKETCAELIADQGLHNLQWKPHNTWWSTACNPLPWGEIMARAKQIWQEKYGQPAPKPQWQQNMKKWDKPRTMYARDDNTPLRNLANTPQIIKNFAKATPFEIAAETKVGDYVYYLTRYAYENGTGQGFDTYELQDTDPNAVPEWLKNRTDTPDVKLFVLPAGGTNVVNLNTGAAISVLPKGTAVDIAMQTVVGGKRYLISSYSVTNSMPNGILADDLGELAKPPEQEKPEWLKNLEDIKDVTGYTRAEVPLVNLIDGSTIKMLPINTPIEIATATEWHGQRYFISKYATEKQQPNGILVAHISDEPIKNPEEPAEPAPEQPDLNARVTLIEKFIEALKALLAKIGIKL